MFNLLTLAIGISTIIALAKINKSNKLFWTLLVSMLLGFASGSIVGKFNSVGKKKVGISYVTPMHESTSPTAIYSPATIEDTHVAISTNRVSQSYTYRDIIPTRTNDAFNPDYDIGTYDTENTS